MRLSGFAREIYELIRLDNQIGAIMLMNIKMNQILTSMLLSLQVILFSSCDFKSDSAVKDETITSTEIFIQGVGMDMQRVTFNSTGSHLITSGKNGTTIWDMQAKKELITVLKNEAHSSYI